MLIDQKEQNFGGYNYCWQRDVRYGKWNACWQYGMRLSIWYCMQTNVIDLSLSVHFLFQSITVIESIAIIHHLKNVHTW